MSDIDVVAWFKVAWSLKPQFFPGLTTAAGHLLAVALGHSPLTPALVLYVGGQVRPWWREGFNPDEALSWIEVTRDIDQYETNDAYKEVTRARLARGFSDAGLSPHDAVGWIHHGIKPDAAKKWRDDCLNSKVDIPANASTWLAASFDAEDAWFWRQAGFDVRAASKWVAAGFDPDQAKAWRAGGFPPETAALLCVGTSIEGASTTWAGVPPIAVAEWGREGLLPVDMAAWDRLGVAATDAGRLQRSGVSPDRFDGEWKGFTGPEAASWAVTGFEGVEAWTWRSEGFTCDQASVWAQAGLDLEAARDWRPIAAPFAAAALRSLGWEPVNLQWNGASLSSVEVERLRDESISPQELEAWQAKVDKFDLMIDYKANGLTPTAIDEWLRSGFKLNVLSELVRSPGGVGGASLDSLIQEAIARRVRNDSLRHESETTLTVNCATDEWTAIGIKSNQIAEWVTRGFTPDSARRWRAASFSAPDAEVWESRGEGPDGWLDAGIPPSKIAAWRAAGFSADVAKRWHAAGFSAKEAGEWKEAKLGFSVARRWRDEGLSPKEASQWAPSKITPQQAMGLTQHGCPPLGPFTLHNTKLISHLASRTPEDLEAILSLFPDEPELPWVRGAVLGQWEERRWDELGFVPHQVELLKGSGVDVATAEKLRDEGESAVDIWRRFRQTQGSRS